MFKFVVECSYVIEPKPGVTLNNGMLISHYT